MVFDKVSVCCWFPERGNYWSWFCMESSKNNKKTWRPWPLIPWLLRVLESIIISDKVRYVTRIVYFSMEICSFSISFLLEFPCKWQNPSKNLYLPQWALGVSFRIFHHQIWNIIFIVYVQNRVSILNLSWQLKQWI